MAEPPKRPVPGRRPPPDPMRSRILALAGVVGLFVVLILIVTTISGGGDDDGETAAAPTATATPTPKPTRTPKPKPTAVPLTPDEKLDRQNDIDVVRSRGFEIVNKRDWKPDDTLQVLIGRSTSGGELAFFFVDGQYLGNDSSDTSGKLRAAQDRRPVGDARATASTSRATTPRSRRATRSTSSSATKAAP